MGEERGQAGTDPTERLQKSVSLIIPAPSPPRGATPTDIFPSVRNATQVQQERWLAALHLSLIHISEPTRRA